MITVRRTSNCRNSRKGIGISGGPGRIRSSDREVEKICDSVRPVRFGLDGRSQQSDQMLFHESGRNALGRLLQRIKIVRGFRISRRSGARYHVFHQETRSRDKLR